MMCSQNSLQYHPNMTPAEAARVWMTLNECTADGLAAITDNGDGTMSIKYSISRHGIVVYLHDGTCIPVPYRYDGSMHNLYVQ